MILFGQEGFMKIKYLPEISTWQIKIEPSPAPEKPRIADVDIHFLRKICERQLIGERFCIKILNLTGARLDDMQKFSLFGWMAAYEPEFEDRVIACAYHSPHHTIDFAEMDPAKAFYPPFAMRSFANEKESEEWLKEMLETRMPLKPIKKIRKKRSPKRSND